MQALALPFPDEIIRFRHRLHQYPELSGQETETAKYVASFMEKYAPDAILQDVGGTGVIIIFNSSSGAEGPTILFRAELDALPIEDINDITYRSEHAGVGHKCGHDGHMAILAGLGSLLQQARPEKGRVMLLFQPAEETGAGAHAVLLDKRFHILKPDYVFALHNLPGVPHHQVVIRRGVFAAASSGMIIEMEGKSSHAAEPEKGISPALAVADIIQQLNSITQDKTQFSELTLLTIVHVRVGEIAFGTNPGHGTVMATLRAYQPADFSRLKTMAVQVAEKAATIHNLKLNIRFVEEFQATVNDEPATNLIREAAQMADLSVRTAETPFRWSEDFGRFTDAYTGALFGLGAGTNQPELHHPDYDFPDEIIPTGSHLFYNLVKLILNNN